MTNPPGTAHPPRTTVPVQHRLDAVPFGRPHPSAGLEWWYLTGHLAAPDGERHHWAVAIFRHADPHGRADEPGYCCYFVHSHHQRMASGTWITPRGLKGLREALRRDEATDPRVREALAEALREGPLLPDRLLEGTVTDCPTRLDIALGTLASLQEEGNGTYRLRFHADGQPELDLTLTAEKPGVPQLNEQGRLPGRAGDGQDELTTHVSPRLRVSGTLTTAEGVGVDCVGQAWFEHTWGGSWYRARRSAATADRAWEWAGLQLDNGWEISAPLTYHAAPASGHRTIVHDRATAVAPDGTVTYPALSWQAIRRWTSAATLNTYPTQVRLAIPDLGLHVDVTGPDTPHEVRTFTAGRALWESPATVTGTMNGTALSGVAYLETLPSNTVGDIEHYMRRAHDIARAEAAALYSADPDDHAALSLLTGTGGATDLDAATLARLHRAVSAPVLHLLDNPGRSWRPYIAATVLCLFGVDPEPYRPLTAITELLHVSALIIDDIQDDSPTRRGRPSVHEVFGTAPAITAGTLGYYTFDALMQRVPQADAATMLRIHRLYLRDLRAAHAGQALDIAGHHAAFDEAVTTGDAGPLLRQVRAAHRLKTGMLVRSTAEIAATLAGADEEELGAVCRYFEALGIAYQITDDIADLYGLCTPEEHERGIVTRQPAEDLRNGEVTYPVAHAVGRLDAADRRRLRDALRQRSGTGALAASDLLLRSGALDACTDEARALVDDAWSTLSPLLPPTLHKAMVRALGWYAAQRETDHVSPTAPPS
ncbi:polyprenyl synthetase family protein [Streptomyces sp. Go40/10]|uniref:polyprenyl synthetase family protein n=1 Tax=Streptomyces sp. Go40/10 TaxID=2825844 RepID=UPI001E29A7EB|nr:polyprenyl synthetase family protein [Streptomyces sp. Go40/10]UFR00213.1 polyprenyl synthetase family protein [Streptomyces sp. Go40/10]